MNLGQWRVLWVGRREIIKVIDLFHILAVVRGEEVF